MGTLHAGRYIMLEKRLYNSVTFSFLNSNPATVTHILLLLAQLLLIMCSSLNLNPICSRDRLMCELQVACYSHRKLIFYYILLSIMRAFSILYYNPTLYYFLRQHLSFVYWNRGKQGVLCPRDGVKFFLFVYDKPEGQYRE